MADTNQKFTIQKPEGRLSCPNPTCRAWITSENEKVRIKTYGCFHCGATIKVTKPPIPQERIKGLEDTIKNEALEWHKIVERRDIRIAALESQLKLGNLDKLLSEIEQASQ